MMVATRSLSLEVLVTFPTLQKKKQKLHTCSMLYRRLMLSIFGLLRTEHLVVAVDVEYVDDEDGPVHEEQEDGEVVGVHRRLQRLCEL
jgi:hypothetical protein